MFLKIQINVKIHGEQNIKMLKTGWNDWFFLQPEARPYDWSCQMLLINWDPWPSPQCHPAAFCHSCPLHPIVPSLPSPGWESCMVDGGICVACPRGAVKSPLLAKGPSVKSGPDLGVGRPCSQRRTWNLGRTSNPAPGQTNNWAVSSQPRQALQLPSIPSEVGMSSLRPGTTPSRSHRVVTVRGCLWHKPHKQTCGVSMTVLWRLLSLFVCLFIWYCLCSF